MATIKYFSGETELANIWGEKTARFLAIGGVKSKANRYDSFHRLIGVTKGEEKAYMPVTRKIAYKSNPSLHTCDARCRCAKGGNCECSCGGKYHGIDS